MKIYVASSWRNGNSSTVVRTLRSVGHEVYDFRAASINPAVTEDKGFHWSDIDPDWQRWSPEEYVKSLDHTIAEAGFRSDFDAMEWADALVLIQPCGRSAHLELGWAVGVGKRTAILLADGEPELMVKMVDRLCLDMSEVLAWLDEATP